MIFDITVVVILVACMVLGFRRGFIYSFVNTLGWIGSILGAFVGCRLLAGQLSMRTDFDETIYTKIYENISGSFESAATSADTLPLILNETIDTAAASAAEVLAQRLTDMTVLILSFLIIFIVIKLICYLITTALSKRHNDGFIGFFDGLLGFIAGSIKGILIVFLFLMLLVPGLNLMSPESAEVALRGLENSHIAGTLYDANFLVLVLS
ncbi:MAG: CvpA family protein [Firmicutes bacterium]|nr:CvpA family protein [Bacillota bacterium]